MKSVKLDSETLEYLDDSRGNLTRNQFIKKLVPMPRPVAFEHSIIEINTLKSVLDGNFNLIDDLLYIKIHFEAFKLAIKEIILNENGKNSIEIVRNYLKRFEEK